MKEDSALLRDYVTNRSETAFGELVRRHVDLVYAAALRSLNGDVHAAEDVAQEAFTLLARKAPSLQRHPALTGWLYTTAHFLAARAKRSRERRRWRENEAQIMNDVLSDSTPHTDWDKIRPILDDAMLALDHRDREAVLLRFFKRCCFAEIGSRLRLTEDGARKRVDRALEKLAGVFARKGVTSTASTLALALANQPLVAAPAGLVATATAAGLAGKSVAGAAMGMEFGTFMLNTKTSICITSFAILAAGSAIYEGIELRKAGAELVATRKENEILSVRAGAAERSRSDAEARIAAPAAIANQQPSSKGTQPISGGSAGIPPPKAVPGTGAVPQRPTLGETLLLNPSFQQAALRYARASLGLNFGSFYQKLGLSVPQIAAFENAVAEHEQANMEMRVAAVSQGVSPADPALTALRKDSDATMSQALRRILGADGYSQYLEYTKVIEARATSVEPLAASLYYTDTPLTAAQAEGLVQLIAANTGKPTTSGLATASPVTNWPAVLAQAANVLSGPQLTTLRALREKAEAFKHMSEISASLSRVAPASDTGNITTKSSSG